MKKIDSYRMYIGTAIAFRFCWAIMTVVSMVVMVSVAGLDPLQMVLVGTVLELSTFLFEIPTGLVADVYSRRLSIIIGYILWGVGYSLMGFFPVFEVILLSQIIWGLGATFLSGANQAWISDEIGEERSGKLFIRASQLGQAGFLLGIPLGVALAMIDLTLPILVGSLGCVLIGVFCFFYMDEKPFSKTTEEERASWHNLAATFSRGVILVKSRPILWMIMIIAVIEGMFSEGYDRLNVPHLIEAVEFPVIAGLDTVIWWGVLSAGATLLSIFAIGIVRRVVKTTDYRHLVLGLSISTALLVVMMIGFALAGNFYLAIAAYFSITVLRVVKGPLTTAWLNNNLQADTRATVFSMHAQADALGQAGGGPVIGIIARFVAIKAALIVSALLLLPAILVYRKALSTEQSGTKKPNSA